MSSLTGKWWLCSAALVGVSTLVVTSLTPAQDPCDEGCFETLEYCDSASVFKMFCPAVALDTFWDPETDPDQYADNVDTVYEIDREGCECRCKHIDCVFPCRGVYLGGKNRVVGDVLMTTECVDPAS